MRYALRLGVLLLAFAATKTPALAADCKVGTTVTLTYFMLYGPPTQDGDEWIADGDRAQPCTVGLIIGKGKVPATCKADTTITVTGKVVENIRPMLEATSVSCK